MAQGVKLELTDEVLAKVEALAAQGMLQQDIALCLGIRADTFSAKKANSSRLSQAIKKGQAKGVALVTQNLLNNIRNGNVTAQIFYLKCKGQWREEKPDDKSADLKEALDVIKELANKCLVTPTK